MGPKSDLFGLLEQNYYRLDILPTVSKHEMYKLKLH